MHSLSEYTPFDSEHEHRRSKVTFRQRYFFPEVLSNKKRLCTLLNKSSVYL